MTDMALMKPTGKPGDWFLFFPLKPLLASVPAVLSYGLLFPRCISLFSQTPGSRDLSLHHNWGKCLDYEGAEKLKVLGIQCHFGQFRFYSN